MSSTRRNSPAEAPASKDEFVRKWRRESDTMRRRGVVLSGADLCDEILQDLEAVLGNESTGSLTLTQASHESGLSVEHLGRLVREGIIPNAGRKHAPRILRRDLPRKPGALRNAAKSPQLVGATPGQIARAVVTSKGDPR